MKLNLLPLPYMIARNIIYWCWEHDIDKQQCAKIIQAMAEIGGGGLSDAEWQLDIPDKYATWFALKWGFGNDTEIKNRLES